MLSVLILSEDPGVDPMATYKDYRGRTYALPEYFHPTAWVGREAVDFINSYNYQVRSS